MYIIAENIQILSSRVKKAIQDKDADFFRTEIERLEEAGADAIDLNIGPARKNGTEVLPWLVGIAEEVTNLPLSFDTTNTDAIEAACQVVSKAQPIINSTDCKEERLAVVPPIAKKYDTRLIGLTMAEGLIPVSADERVGLAMERLIPALVEIDYPIENLIVDPLVLTVSGCQEYCPECIKAVQMIPFAWDPAPQTNVGLSNVSNAVPDEMRPLLNRVYCVMLLGAGVDCAIADPTDSKLKDFIRIVEERDDSTALNRLLLTLHDKVAAMEELEADDVDMDDPEQVDIWKTVQVLENKVIYTDAYLR
jgi:5-methyltetrahydrofolate corrinoid/iron sulfur protein methyltransferase